MSNTRDNHYVPQWYQKGFLNNNSNNLCYLDLYPDKKELPDGVETWAFGWRARVFLPHTILLIFLAQWSEHRPIRTTKKRRKASVRLPGIFYCFGFQNSFSTHSTFQK